MVEGPTQELPSAPESSGALRIGQVLEGRYRIDALVGEGGMGTVFRATQLALQREVAIKLLRAPDPTHHARLQREALALAALQHRAIVAVHDFGETRSGEPFLVMELVRGASLEAHLVREGSLPAPRAVELLLPLLDALVYAHARGVVHRDLKPSNVLLSEGPEGVVPKLVDFGIALLTAQPALRVTGTMVVGTPVYMAPEQLRGLPLDPRVDVWGAGTLLYEMIAGQPPFGGSELPRVFARVLEEPPSFPRHARGLDGRLWSILMDALRKTPEQRLPSIEALRGALLDWRDAERPLATAPTVPPPASPAPASPAPGPASSLDALIRDKLGGG